MFKIVQSYLSEYYKVDKNKEGQFIICSLNIYPIELIYWSKLSDELELIFSVDKNSLKKYISKWAGVNLKAYFEIIPPFIPHVSNVVASLLSQDLVNVRPMDGPTGQLFYFDYQYSANTQHQGQINQIRQNNVRNIRLFGD